MRILSVIESFGHGGAETVLMDLVLGLTEHAHQVVHFSGANEVPPHQFFIDALAAAGVRCIDAHWSCLDDPLSRQATLGDFHPDVVIFHWWGKDPWLHWLNETSGQPVGTRPAFVCVLHHAGIRAAVGYDRYVLVAPNQAPQAAHLPSELVTRIPNGIDLARFAAAEPARPRAGSSRSMIVGRLNNLRPPKVPADWVRTLTSFAVPNTRFVIAGEGPMRAVLEADAAALAPPGTFLFPGYVPRADVPGLLRGFDVFCYATAEAEECHPLALLEALAAGLPIVAEAKGGVPSIVTHERNGLLASSVAEIGPHLRRLQAEPALRDSLAAAALTDAREFSLDLQLSRYRALLSELQHSPAR